MAAACGADEVPAGPARRRRVPLGQPLGGDGVDVGQVDDEATTVEALLPGEHGVEDERDQVVIAGAESKAPSRAIGHGHADWIVVAWSRGSAIMHIYGCDGSRECGLGGIYGKLNRIQSSGTCMVIHSLFSARVLDSVPNAQFLFELLQMISFLVAD